jgi:vancomycin resistance protein YoaR
MPDTAEDKSELSEIKNRLNLVQFGKALKKPDRGFPWWYLPIPVLLVIAALAFFAYLAIARVSPLWAIGASGWTAPPGSEFGGVEIGGKNLDQTIAALSTVVEEFRGSRIWLVENPSHVSTVPGELTISTVGDEIAVSVAADELGIRIDIDTMRREIESLDNSSKSLLSIGHRLVMWNDPPSFDIPLKLTESAIRDGLREIKESTDREPLNARLDLTNRTVKPAHDGINIDIDSTFASIPRRIASPTDFAAKLIARRTPAAVSSDGFRDINLETPLSAYTTRFSTAKVNRSRNIAMVAAHFEEVVIGPDEVFSFNSTTGPRTGTEGYLLAPMYRNNRVELSPAGGSCQVSTTLYNAALLAGMEIVDRHPHSRPCSYVPYGRDAAVAYDSGVDLKFKNTRSHPVIIHQEVEGGTITFEIFGHPDDRVNVSIGNAYSWIGRSASSTTYVLDTSLRPGHQSVDDSGCNGIVQRAWRNWYDEAGNKVKEEPLSSDRVSPIGALIRYNPAPGTTGPPVAETPSQETPSEPAPDEPSPDAPPQGIF